MLKTKLFKILTESALIFHRELLQSLRNRVWVVIGLMQPVLFLVFFGPLLTRITSIPGFPARNAWQIFVPGLLVQLGLFSSAFVGFSLLEDIRNGVVERMRVTPASRLALLMGRVARDAIVLLAQSGILLLVALPFGLTAALPGLLVSMVLVVLTGISMASLSYGAAMILKSEDSLAPMLNAITVPLLLLSGILLPMSLAPTWLFDLAHINPFFYVVQALRSAFLGNFDSSNFVQGSVVSILLTAVSILFGFATFMRENV